MKRIPIAGPWVTEKEVNYVADAAAHAWYENAGHYPQRFEAAFAEYIGVKHAVSLPHCTAAIHLSLAALGVGPGDEVILPETTWIASAAPVHYVGAEPVFVDVRADTWCLDVESLRRAITPRTKAIIAVDVYGGLPDMIALRQLASERGLAVIEDAAEAFGSEFAGRRAGVFGDTGVFSFHGSKTLTTGEGGMLVTNRDDVHQRVLTLRDHGRAPGDTDFFNQEVAFKYRMSALQAAFGLAQLERAAELVEKKRTVFSWYREALADLPDVSLNAEPSGTYNSYWMVTIVWPAEWGLAPKSLREALAKSGIDTRPFFHPLSSLPAYRAHPSALEAQRRNPMAYSLASRGINLPSALCLTREDVQRVTDALRCEFSRAIS